MAGAIADRYSKRDVMIITDILSAGLTIGLLLSQSILSALTLIFIRSAIYSLNAPTQQAYVKEVVPYTQLLEVSSYTTISFSLAKNSIILTFFILFFKEIIQSYYIRNHLFRIYTWL